MMFLCLLNFVIPGQINGSSMEPPSTAPGEKSAPGRSSRTKSAQALWSDPEQLTQFGTLEIVSQLIVEGYMTGLHKSPFKGSSIEFVEHRQYYPGDEIRHIDWRAYGKTGRYHIKEFEDETNLHCYLLVDASGSMGYTGAHLAKFDYARFIAAAFGYLLVRQRDAVGLVTWDTEIKHRLEPSTRAAGFRRICEALGKCQVGGETSLSGVLEAFVPTMKRRSLVVIVSDGFDHPDHFMKALRQLRHARHEVILLQVLAPEEFEFPFHRPTEFRSLESAGQRLLVDPHRLREVYRTQFRDFLAEIERRSAEIGVDFHRLRVDEPLGQSLGGFLARRSGRQTVR